MTMMSENELTLIGVTWMVSRYDEFVRELYVQAGMNPRCAACHGVPGYADPCPSLVSTNYVTPSSSLSLPLLCVATLLSLAL